MEKIASFTIDHIKLQPGVYVSRTDKIGNEVITTFDLRMTSPNEEPVMNTAYGLPHRILSVVGRFAQQPGYHALDGGNV